MKIEVDKESGFCPGVVSAIRKAEGKLQVRPSLYCLGDIVHNSQEVKRLETQGLITISREELQSLHDVTVMLRAHGEPPSTYELAERQGIEIVDATCPVVLQLQRKIRRIYESEPSAQIVIFGKHGHAEVVGLVGQTENTAIVVEHDDELSKIDFSRPVRLFSQTTMSVEEFKKLSAAIGQKNEKSGRVADVRHHLPTGGQSHPAHARICLATRRDTLRERQEIEQRQGAL